MINETGFRNVCFCENSPVEEKRGENIFILSSEDVFISKILVSIS